MGLNMLGFGGLVIELNVIGKIEISKYNLILRIFYK